MSWLLKIVEGPMKGAEIALVNGFKVKVGSGDACDIVIADQTLAAVAFELDVAEAGVTLVRASGEAKTLRAFEVVQIETTALAVGPSEGTWKPLVWPAPEPEEKPVEKAVESAEETAPETAPESAEKPEETQAEEVTPKKKVHRGLGCLVWLVVLILVGVAIWWFWPRIVEKCPKAEDCRVVVAKTASTCWTKTVDVSKRGYAWTKSQFEKPLPPPVVLPSLGEIAAEHNLTLVESDGRTILKGNCRRRTERLAIRALALASEPTVSFDLTDDESLKTAANELLFVVTEGAVKAVSASNRVVEIEGYAPNRVQLEKAIRALNADVPGIERLITARVRVGGVTPKEVEKSTFANPEKPEANVPAPMAPKMQARRDYPIAGILSAPYPCVVMRNGLRLMEGAQIGTAVIEKIEADRLVLRDGRTSFEWHP